jgi:alpha-tubulin suppressor-like RCC1 family protein
MTPRAVACPSGSVNVVQVLAGHAFSMVLTSDGRVYVWGRNEQGQVSSHPPLPQSHPNQMALQCLGHSGPTCL